MINTVADGVTLTDEITLLPAKVHDVQLTIERNLLVLKSSLRVRSLIPPKLMKAMLTLLLTAHTSYQRDN